MYEVIVLIDECVCVSIPTVGIKASAASKAVKMCIDRGYKTVIVLGVKKSMTRISF